MTVHCFTSASFAYLDRVRVLGETLHRFHPDWVLWLCLSDEEPPGFDWAPSNEVFGKVVRLQEIGIDNLTGWIFEHDVVELCTAVKGAMLCKLLDAGAEKVIYLDPDIAVFSDLSPVVDLLDTHPVILTPHQLAPDSTRATIMDNEISSLKHGIYNLGFIAVSAHPEGRRFARWWRDRLLMFCFDDIPNGLFTDQRWCDLVPAYFDNVHILRDPGYNVASWNLSQREVCIDNTGTIVAGGSRLRFFHFTKVTHVGERMLERYAGGRIEVFELMHWYLGRVRAHAVVGISERWWAYGHYRDGTPIKKAERIAYRSRSDLRQLHPDPFVAGPEIFQV